MAPETGAAASALASVAGRASAACWDPQKQLTVLRKTTCSPPARQEADPVDLKEDAALPQDFAVMQVRNYIQYSDYLSKNSNTTLLEYSIRSKSTVQIHIILNEKHREALSVYIMYILYYLIITTALLYYVNSILML